MCEYSIYIKWNDEQNYSMVLQDSIVVSLVGGIIIGREQRGVGGMLVMLHFLMEVLLI